MSFTYFDELSPPGGKHCTYFFSHCTFLKMCWDNYDVFLFIQCADHLTISFIASLCDIPADNFPKHSARFYISFRQQMVSIDS